MGICGVVYHIVTFLLPALVEGLCLVRTKMFMGFFSAFYVRFARVWLESALGGGLSSLGVVIEFTMGSVEFRRVVKVVSVSTRFGNCLAAFTGLCRGLVFAQAVPKP